MAGIYIHIPFCKQACTYCNFHFSTSLVKREAFLQALHTEILFKNDFIPKEIPIETIYFGGGTPSLLNQSELAAIINLLYKEFPVASDVEITLEANPDDINSASLQKWNNIGINRLSVGVQSFIEEELRWMNRAHSAKNAIECIHDIQSSGIDNFSVDLIFGSPLLSNNQLKENIGILVDSNIPHISCYALTVEAKTALHKAITTQQSPEIDSEKQAEHFLMVSDLLCEAGYEHYEISNYAKPGKRSKHNSSYWEGKSYYGFGPSAHSFNGKNKRRWNIANNTLYISNINNNVPIFEEEELSDIAQLNEHIMIGLRKSEGFDTETIRMKFGNSIQEKLLQKINEYVLDKKITFQNNQVQLTREGKLFADGIAADLFF